MLFSSKLIQINVASILMMKICKNWFNNKKTKLRLK